MLVSFKNHVLEAQDEITPWCPKSMKWERAAWLHKELLLGAQEGKEVVQSPAMRSGFAGRLESHGS